jgi:hypothetical protein
MLRCTCDDRGLIMLIIRFVSEKNLILYVTSFIIKLCLIIIEPIIEPTVI